MQQRYAIIVYVVVESGQLMWDVNGTTHSQMSVPMALIDYRNMEKFWSFTPGFELRIQQPTIQHPNDNYSNKWMNETSNNNTQYDNIVSITCVQI